MEEQKIALAGFYLGQGNPARPQAWIWKVLVSQYQDNESINYRIWIIFLMEEVRMVG